MTIMRVKINKVNLHLRDLEKMETAAKIGKKISGTTLYKCSNIHI